MKSQPSAFLMPQIRMLRFRRMAAYWTLLFSLFPNSALPIADDAKDSPLSAGALHETKEDLEVAIRAISDVKILKRDFKDDIRNKGLLPFHLAVTNRSAKEGWIILANQAVLFDAAAAPRKSGEQYSGNAKGGQAVTTAGMLSAAVVPAALPIAIIGAATMVSASKIKQNIVKREFHNQTLSPGQTAEGYLYFGFSKKAPLPAHFFIRVKAVSTVDNREIVFQFGF